MIPGNNDARHSAAALKVVMTSPPKSIMILTAFGDSKKKILPGLFYLPESEVGKRKLKERCLFRFDITRLVIVK
jgi:hypothetical protein